MTPVVSVVLATRDRPALLARTLLAIRAQTLSDDEYEIVVVDDASGRETVELLRREAATCGPHVHVVRRDVSRGLAAARNAGIEAARGALVAMTDDDCTPDPGWLSAGLAAWEGEPMRFVQGRTLPDPHQAHLLNQFAHTLRVEKLGPLFETANMFYPRRLLETLGGMDAESFPRWGAEDVDLAWRAIGAGAEPVWAPDALVYHAVITLRPAHLLRRAWRWEDSMLLVKRHPQLRRRMPLRVFWIARHWALLRAGVALALPRRFWWLRWFLAAPYVVRLGTLRPDHVVVLVASDLLEIASCVRGSIRHRVVAL